MIIVYPSAQNITPYCSTDFFVSHYLNSIIFINITQNQMETNHFQAPKTAIIRLLKSQGCCQSQTHHQNNPHLEQMINYREELSLKAAQERSRLSQIPCAVKLAEEVQELKDVVTGLTRENKGRVEHLMKMKQKVSINGSWEVNDSQQQLQHQRLQQQYANLLKTLQSTNETNRRLVQRLARW